MRRSGARSDVGASPANDRKKGFDEAIKSEPGMKLLASQSGDFARDKGRQVAETLLQAHPETTVIYAHNDEMAIGAIAALEAGGKVPGKDVLVVSIDGERDALLAIIDGKMGCSCECNPRFGPKAFETMAKYAAGETIPAYIKNVEPMVGGPHHRYDRGPAIGGDKTLLRRFVVVPASARVRKSREAMETMSAFPFQAGPPRLIRC